METTIELGLFKVAGLVYHDFKNLCDSDLELIGQPVRLELEPTNKYDSFAIMILSEHNMLGYVPKPHNIIIHNLLNQPDLCVVTATVHTVDLVHNSITISFSLQV